jgi:murein DD-endopeptidase MepM/ murein hydrolase activator NlpD
VIRRLLLAAALLLACAGAASASTFSLVTAPATLPSAQVPNLPGSLVLPPPLLAPPARPEQLSDAQLSGLWRSAGAAYGIPWQVLAAINKVESDFGRNMGPSSAGAIGWMQFMPSTWLRWGVDADGDGVADPWRAADAIYAAARYLAASGGQTDVARAVFSYNHAQWYVDEVLATARLFESGGAVTVDRLQEGLSTSSAAIDAASHELAIARVRAAALARVEARFLRRADTAPLLSDRLDARKQAVQLDVRRQALLAQAARAKERLAAARQRLTVARTSARTASFDPSARTLLTTDYVFPVGGGPSVVFASHTHHDYPAVDIAAPMGSPLYALANGVVLRAWPTPGGRCGIGLTMRAEDGLAWTYCHMSVLDPAIHAGSVVSAGTPVGQVGETGHATGPHLHLQLQPPTQWPQQMSWFQSFAGSAFTWSDVPATSEPSGAPRAVFSVVPTVRSPVVGFTR